MCGFAGVINKKGSLSQDYLKALANKVNYRGPDSTGIAVLENMRGAAGHTTALFFNRLAIIDLNARSNQPFERDNCVLVYNGEIYNYRAIKQELQALGHMFETTSDTEVLFHALQQWGKDAIPRLNGMFAFCWINKRNGQFLLCRDRLGIKPLYYTQHEGSIIFASELHTVLRLTPGRPAISLQAVKMYLWMQYVPTPFTIIENIYKLPPGHWLEGSVEALQQGEQLAPTAYWDAYQEVNKARQSRSIDLEATLKLSLERQLEADVPLGLFLSSGVDSSLLAAMVNKYFARDRDFSFFTVAYKEKTHLDESDDARDYINGFHNPRLHCHTLVVDPDYISHHLDKLYNYFDEPFADSASLLNWTISQKAREHVTVAISGDGADELFWGYPRYRWWQVLTSLQVKGLSPLLAAMIKPFARGQLLYNALYVLESDPVKRHFDTFLSAGLRHMITESVTENRIWAMEGTKAIAHRRDLPAILDIKTYLADAMLYKVDRASMAASLEVRVPYLDNEMLDLSLHLPFAEKSDKQFRHKSVLKKLLLQLAPHYNINNPKKGFNFPVEKWLRGEWKNRVRDSITRTALHKLGLDDKVFMKMLDRFYHHGKGNYTDIWILYNLVLWHDQFAELFSGFHNE